MRADGDGRGRDDDVHRNHVPIARLPSRFCPRQFSTAAFAARFKLSRSPRHGRTTGFDAANELGTKSGTLAGSFSRPRFARPSQRYSGFLSAAAALRLAKASSPATASVSTAVASDGVADAASDGTADTSFGKVVHASADSVDNSSCTTVRALGQARSTQTPWRLRSAGFASVDSPISFHEILVLLYALRRSNLTPDALMLPFPPAPALA